MEEITVKGERIGRAACAAALILHSLYHAPYLFDSSSVIVSTDVGNNVALRLQVPAGGE